jgi:hypothetical protein
MANYRISEMTPDTNTSHKPVVIPGVSEPPFGATDAYFYSPHQAQLTKSHRLVQIRSGAEKLPYTEDIPLTFHDSQQQVDGYLKRFPDAHLVKFGDEKAKTFPGVGPSETIKSQPMTLRPGGP